MLAFTGSVTFRRVIFRNFSANNLAVEREGLQHNIQALAVLVVKYEAEIEPESLQNPHGTHR
jgi:hypothetical protein